MALDVEPQTSAGPHSGSALLNQQWVASAFELGGLLATRARARLPALAAGLLVVALAMLASPGSFAAWLILSVAMALAVLVPGDGTTVAPVPSATASAVTTSPAPVLPEPSVLTWRSVLDAISDPALVLDGNGEVVHFNPAVADLFPRVRAGQPLSWLTRSPELLDAIERARAGEDRVMAELEDRVPIKRRVSAIVTALAATPRSPMADGRRLLVVFRDITDQETLAQMRADFISNASHELRTPLASLRGFVETLQGPARDDPIARDKFLSIMGAQALRMTHLIDDLLSLSRIEMRVHVPPQSDVDLDEVVAFVTETMLPVAQAAGVTLKVDTIGPPCEVRGERDELVQVFQNLIHNAIKYGRANGTVVVSLTRDKTTGRFAVSVSDNGPGIEEHHLPRLTERFYRVNVAASRDKGGTGLGLAIVKNIVNRHRGELLIASRLGAGSTFTVLLPHSPGQTSALDDTP